ncbi:hypothetical protein BWK58_09880 [Flavobacterium columnare]|nr:hypothetical protein BWK58_09880 [Flavobacterium columnare]
MTKIIGCKFDRDEIVIYRHKKEIIDAHTQKLLEEERKKVRKDDVVVVDMGYTNHATFYLDASCFENEALVPNSKWAVVYQDAFAEAQIQHKTIPSSLWALNEGRVPIDYLGMKRHYKIGNSLTVKLLENSQSVYYYGYIQKVIVFTDRPEEGFSFSIIPVSRPRISFAYFENSEKNWRYGEIVNLSIHYHNLCTTNHDTLFSQVFIVEANEANAAIKAEEGDDIDLESLKESSVWQSGEFKMAQVDKKATGFNSRIPFSVLIDYEKWRKGEAKEKTFSLIVVVYRTEYPYNIKSEKVVSFRNFITNPTKDLYQYNPETLSLKDINIKEDAISSRIVVQKDFMSEILAKREIEVNNMIQYVGDIAYNRKEYDPCGYSKITIKDEDDDEREALVIFDENNIPAPKDQTEKIFGIIAGDKRKKISITIDQLKNKRVFCHGLLLEAGEDHSKQKNVFQVDKVYTAKKIRDKNNHEIYLEKKDHTHQEQLKKSNSPITKENKEDYDVIRTDNSYNPSAVQGWQEGLDYKFEGANQLVIMPSYIYNKTILENIPTTISSSLGKEALNTLWLFNYFILKEDLAQTYFLPISTCRYPNQLAKIKVYPDIEWEVAFLITTGTGYSGNIRYERKRLNSIHKGYKFKYLKDDLQIGVTKSSTIGYSIMGKCIVNEEEHSLGFEGIQKSVDLLVSTFNACKEILEVLNPEGINVNESSAVSKKVIKIDFAIDPPNIGFALSKKFGEASNKRIVPIYKGGFRADPFIGITISVDLVPIFTKFTRGMYGVGYILEFIVNTIKWVSNSEIYITFEAGLSVKFDFKLSYNLVDGFDKKGNAEQEIIVEVPISIKAGCKSEDVVIIPAVTKGGRTYPEHEEQKWEVEGDLSTTFTFTKTYGYDQNKQYEKSKGIWNSAEITISCYELVTSKIIRSPVKSDKFKLFDEKTLFDNPKTYVDEN